jgi:hypothetical protein
MTPLIPVTERDIDEVLGDVDPLTIARILEIGASRAELEVAAASELEAQAYVEEERTPDSQRVAELRQIMAELAEAETDEAYGTADEARA